MHHRTVRTTRRIAGALSALALALMLAFSIGLAGCSGAGEGSSAGETGGTESPAAVFPVTVTDDAGREVTVEAEPQRIVSLAPANTEIVAALGLLDRLVGVTTYCDYPPEVAEIEKMGDFVTPNIEAITAAEPDLILATSGVQADVIEQLEATGATVLAIDPQTLEALFASIETVGDATGAAEEAAGVTSAMQSQLADIADAVSAEEPTPCFIEIAQDPLFTAGTGTLLDDLITAAGGRNIVAAEGYVGYSLEQLVTDDPAVYLATMGSMSDPGDLAKRPGYEALSAAKNGRVTVLDDNLVSRPGPRVTEGVASIARALHPDADIPSF